MVKLTVHSGIFYPNGMLNSIESVCIEFRRCSLMAHTKTEARSTPQEWKPVFIFWMDKVLRTTLKISLITALFSFFGQ